MHFPPRYSRVNGDSITLRGVVLDTAGVDQVLINGEPVDTDDGFANWTYTASLQAGENELVISEETTEGVNDIDRIFVERAANITTPTAVVDDHSNNRLLILDTTHNTIISADKDSGALFTLSPAAGETNQITKPRGLALDEARNRLLIFQGRANAKETHAEFLAVDLTTGAQSVFEAPDFATNLYLAHSPRAMVTMGDTAYVADVQFEYVDADGNEVGEDAENIDDFRAGGIVYSINLINGARSVISSRYVPEPEDENKIENPLLIVRSIAYNPTNSTIYALDTESPAGSIPRLIAINVADGKRTLMTLTDADKKAFSLRTPRMLDLDVARQQLFLLSDTNVGDVNDPAVTKIDIATKIAANITANSVPKDGDFLLSQVNGITYSTNDNEIYLLEDTQDVVLRVNITTGVRSVAASTGPVDAKNHISNGTLSDVFFRDDHQTYLLDRKFSSVFGYNLYFGGKDILNNSATNDVEPNDEVLRGPFQGAWDPINETMLLANQTNGVLVSFDPATKEATNQVSLGAVAADMLIDTEAGLAYVAFDRAIIKVDLNDSYRSEYISASNGLPDYSYRFSNVRGIALDAANNRLLAADSGINAIVAVDTTSGARTYFSPPSPTPTAEDVLTLPRAIVIDQPNNRALVLDTGRKAILAADLTTGERSAVYEYEALTPRQLFNPTGMVMHPTFHYLLLLDSTTNMLVALDLAGEAPQLVYLTR